MTDRNLNKVTKLPNETWQQALDFANLQIARLLERCESLVQSEAQSRAEMHKWYDEYTKQNKERHATAEREREANRRLLDAKTEAYRLMGYRERVEQEDDRRGS